MSGYKTYIRSFLLHNALGKKFQNKCICWRQRQIKIKNVNWKYQSPIIVIEILSTKFYLDWGTKTEVMGGGNFVLASVKKSKAGGTVESDALALMIENCWKYLRN